MLTKNGCLVKTNKNLDWIMKLHDENYNLKLRKIFSFVLWPFLNYQRWPGILNQCDMAVLVVEFFKPGWQTATPIEDRVVTLSTSTYQFIYFFSLQLVYTNVCETSNKDNTQVGSPAVRLRLARCTAWVKRWSEAMDFLQTICKGKFRFSG